MPNVLCCIASLVKTANKFKQKTTRKCYEIKRNLTLAFKTSLENTKEIGISITIQL